MKNTINGQPLQWGNPEQIKWLQKQERLMNEMINNGVQLDHEAVNVTVSVEVDFNCIVCGHSISEEMEQEGFRMNSESLDEIFNFHHFRCRSCRSQYMIHNNSIVLRENTKHPKLITKETEI